MSEVTTDLTKVYIDLPNHWWKTGESLWARSLGSDLYEINNVPFCAYGLNLGDVVRATSSEPDKKPEVKAVERRSGNGTLRISFCDNLAKDQQQPILDAVKLNGGEFERINEQFVCVNVAPDAAYEKICSYLIDQETQGRLEYETCEARIPGSFDDKPRAVSNAVQPGVPADRYAAAELIR